VLHLWSKDKQAQNINWLDLREECGSENGGLLVHTYLTTLYQLQGYVTWKVMKCTEENPVQMKCVLP
jgi:hypothetical protein